MKMKDDAQQRRAEQMRGLSPEERLAFYRRAYEALLRRQRKLQGGDQAT
ncbi:MAG: hypothetical protein L6R00_21205 [Phycisphaerae bacterium]|nr:hypothetical protein [Phycisphaerae bacterium]